MSALKLWPTLLRDLGDAADFLDHTAHVLGDEESNLRAAQRGIDYAISRPDLVEPVIAELLALKLKVERLRDECVDGRIAR